MAERFSFQTELEIEVEATLVARGVPERIPSYGTPENYDAGTPDEYTFRFFIGDVEITDSLTMRQRIDLEAEAVEAIE